MPRYVLKSLLFSIYCIIAGGFLWACSDDRSPDNSNNQTGNSNNHTGNSNNHTGNSNNHTSPPETCGNGALDDGEICDGSLLGEETCETQGAGAGVLSCKSNCMGFDRSACAAPETCGNGALDDGEICDGTELNGASCGSLGFDSGTLSCASNCLELNTSSCQKAGSCQPRSCADVGAQCGAVDDGCGKPLDCGGCTDGLTCGGSGAPNICGATCELGCPDGFTCSTQGVCTGDSDTIVVNMPTKTVKLLAKVNGNTPRPNESCQNEWNHLAEIRLTNLLSNDLQSYYIPCNGSPLEVIIPKAKYRVDIQGDRSLDLPEFWHTAHESLDVNTNMTITADMPTRTVKLVAKVNGNTPKPNESCQNEWNHLAEIRFINLLSGDSESYYIPCNGSPLEVIIPKAKYRVDIQGDRSLDLPEFWHTAHESLDVNANMTITADMPTRTVKLVAKVNGNTPRPNESCQNEWNSLAEIRFINLLSNDLQSYYIPCNGSPLEVIIPKAKYRVDIQGDRSLDLPEFWHTTHESLDVNANMTITADMPTQTVKLLAKVNGNTPKSNGSCLNEWNHLAEIRLINLLSGDSESYYIPCNGSPLEVIIPKAKYRVNIQGDRSLDLPEFWHTTHESLDVNANMTITADVPTKTVKLIAKVNGNTPRPNESCLNEWNHLAEIRLINLLSGDSESYYIPCNGSPLEVIIPKAKYRVNIQGDRSLDLPEFWHTTHESLDVNANMTITADVPTKTVKLLAKVNGNTPRPNESCLNEWNHLAEIRLTNLLSGDSESYYIPCNGSPLEVIIPKAKYRVNIQGDRSLDLPELWHAAIQSIEIN